MARMACVLIPLAILAQPTDSGQDRSAVEQERREFAEWIQTSPFSPYKAVTVRPIGPALTLGPDGADIPLAGVPPSRLAQDGGRVRIEAGGASRPVARGRPVSLGARWELLVSGPPGRAAVTVFDRQAKAGKPAQWFGYDPSLRLTVGLTPPGGGRAEPVRLLAPDGVEVEATEAGTIRFRLGGRDHPLRVFRMPGAAAEETELEIYFRDATSGKGTYPSGRFVSLIPVGGTRYVLDLNRARNPFCAYNTVYPCPAPWRGNVVEAPVAAGEKYVEE